MSTARPEDLLATLLAERYSVERELGRGGMATVFLARDLKHDRLVALKVLNPELGAVLGTERFLAEIKVTANLQHPHLLPLFDSGEAGGQLFYVMPYVAGESLRMRLDREKQLPIDEAVRIATAVASALEYAHGLGVIHRDLKPENILLQAGHPVVADFGIALAVSNAGGARITQTGLSLGTPAYMSPEQATGDRQIDGRADLYSLGAMLYEMLVGEPPHSGTTAQAIIAKVLTERPRPIRLARDTVPPHVEAAVERALAKLPADRFGTARELAEALDGRLATLATRQARRPDTVGGGQTARRVIGYIGVALAVGLGGYVLGARAGAPARELPAHWEGQLLGGSLVAMAPSISPDGQSVVFEAMVNNLGQLGVLKPASGDWTVITSDRTRGFVAQPVWSPDGSRIFYTRSSGAPHGIYSISPFGGEERLVLEDAGVSEVLPDGSLLVARINAARIPQVHRFWPETGRLQPLPGGQRSGLNLMMRAFPDGREAVFFGRPLGDSAAVDHLYVIDLETGATRKIAPNLTIPGQVFWFPLATSPDGKWVLFDLPAGDMHRVVAVPRDGGDRVETLLQLTGGLIRLDVGPDWSIYVDQNQSPNELIRYSPETRRTESRRVPVTEGPFLQLPDGRVLMTVRTAGRARVMVVSPGRDPVPFVQTVEETSGPMAMLGRDHVLLQVASDSLAALVVVSIASGRVIHRLRDIKRNEVPSVAGAPDGRTVYFVMRGVVYAMPADGGAPRRIHAGDAVSIDPHGQYLVVKLAEATGARLVRVPLDGSPPVPLSFDSELRLTSDPSGPHAVAKDGRIVMRVAAPWSWFWPAAILDPRKGTIDPIAPAFDRDMAGPGWSEDGHVISQSNGFESTIWRFRPVARPGERK